MLLPAIQYGDWKTVKGRMHRHELDSIGERYYVAVQGQRLWSLPTGLHYVLANMGVPTEVLRAPLPADGPRGLLRYARVAS